MAHRMVCENADLFAGVASLAGSGTRELEFCNPTSPVSVLEIHAENDRTVLYEGMTELSLAERLKRKTLYPYSSISENVRYPALEKTLEYWAHLNGCDLNIPIQSEPVNYALNALGKETRKKIWRIGCQSETEVQFWSLSHGGHVPAFNARFKDDVVDFLLEQKKIR